MKASLCILFQLCFVYAIFCQRVDTVTIYDYQYSVDNWRLELTNKRTFRLLTSMVKENELVAAGTCRKSSDSIRLVCDTTLLKNEYLTSNRLKQFSNIPYLLTGEPFALQRGYIIPYSVQHVLADSVFLPQGIFARYIRGDGFSSYIVELKADSSYIITDHSCTARFHEYGSWSLNNGIVSFSPQEKEYSIIDWISSSRQLYLAGDFLIGYTSKTVRNKEKKKTVEQRYYYFE